MPNTVMTKSLMYTEINFINGMIVRQGQSLGIATPVNSVLTNFLFSTQTVENGWLVMKVMYLRVG